MWVSSSSWCWQPLSFSDKVGHMLLLLVVMITANQQKKKVDLCIKLHFLWLCSTCSVDVGLSHPFTLLFLVLRNNFRPF